MSPGITVYTLLNTPHRDTRTDSQNWLSEVVSCISFFFLVFLFLGIMQFYINLCLFLSYIRLYSSQFLRRWFHLVVSPPRGGLFLSGDLMAMGFQKNLSEQGEILIVLHDWIIISFLIFILLGVIKIFFLINARWTRKKLLSNPILEGMWILSPIGILLGVGLPSVFLLYEGENILREIKNSLVIVGYQWYWGYGRSLAGTDDSIYVELNSEDPVEEWDSLFNLRTSNSIVILGNQVWRLIVTANDVIHRWAIPSIFLKVDAIPGRINTIRILTPSLRGTLYGQCRELCGVLHSSIPITVEIDNLGDLHS